MGRVDETAFVGYFMGTAYGQEHGSDDYNEYLRQVFKSGTDMMLPKHKTDLGHHCFTSIARLPYEFYVNGKVPCKSPVPSTSTWSSAPKDNKGRVTKKMFVDHFKMSEFAKEVDDNGKTQAYTEYLESLFDTGTDMMLPTVKHSLGAHCFGSVEPLVVEFYKDADAKASMFLEEVCAGKNEPLENHWGTDVVDYFV